MINGPKNWLPKGAEGRISVRDKKSNLGGLYYNKNISYGKKLTTEWLQTRFGCIR